MKLRSWRKRKTRREMGGESLGRRRRGCLGWERGGAGGAQPTDQVTPNCTNRTKYPATHSQRTLLLYAMLYAILYAILHRPTSDRSLPMTIDSTTVSNTILQRTQFNILIPKTTRTWQIPPTLSHDTAVKSSFGLDAPSQRFHRSLCTSGSYLSLTCLLLLIVDVVRGDLRFPLCIRNR